MRRRVFRGGARGGAREQQHVLASPRAAWSRAVVQPPLLFSRVENERARGERD